jgi:hypothetical protein
MRKDGLESLSPEAAQLICWLLASNAAARPSLEQISMHPWLTSMAQQQVCPRCREGLWRIDILSGFPRRNLGFW